MIKISNRKLHKVGFSKMSLVNRKIEIARDFYGIILFQKIPLEPQKTYFRMEKDNGYRELIVDAKILNL